MTEMRIAPAAFYFCALHAISIIFFVDNAARPGWFKEAGPAAGTGELCVGTEEDIAADGAIISAFGFAVYILPDKSPFCSLLTGHSV